MQEYLRWHYSLWERSERALQKCTWTTWETQAVRHSAQPRKVQFLPDRNKVYGHTFNAKRIKPNPRKVDTVKAMSPPQSASEVKSLLGMVQYVLRFIPQYPTTTAPLRNLNKQDTPCTYSVTWILGIRERLDILITSEQSYVERLVAGNSVKRQPVVNPMEIYM